MTLTASSPAPCISETVLGRPLGPHRRQDADRAALFLVLSIGPMIPIEVYRFVVFRARHLPILMIGGVLLYDCRPAPIFVPACSARPTPSRRGLARDFLRTTAADEPVRLVSIARVTFLRARLLFTIRLRRPLHVSGCSTRLHTRAPVPAPRQGSARPES